MTPSPQHLEVAKIYLETKIGIKLPLSVLIVPTIPSPLQNAVQSQLTQLPYLQGLTLAHPVTSENEFELSLLIGANHYWDVIEDHIIRGNGPTAMKSKLGYVLSGPLPQKLLTQPQVLSTLLLYRPTNMTCKGSGLLRHLVHHLPVTPTMNQYSPTLTLVFREMMMDPILQDFRGRKLILPHQITDLYVRKEHAP